MGTLDSNTIFYSITLLPSVNTLIAQGMFYGAKYTHHTFTPIIKQQQINGKSVLFCLVWYCVVFCAVLFTARQRLMSTVVLFITHPDAPLGS